MAQYIDKSALVEEIERLQAITMDEDGNFNTAKAQAEYNVLCKIESFLDTLEVKEVDLDEDVDRTLEVKEVYLDEYVDSILEEYDCSYDKIDLYDFAKHFFELGLKTQK